MVLCYGQDRFRCVRCCNLLQELASYLEVLEDTRTGIEQVSGEARKKITGISYLHLALFI